MSATPPEVPPGSVIHDLGYRPYTGPRLGEREIARSLYLTGLGNALGLGRSGRSKVVPFGLLALNLLPSVIMIGVMVVVGLTEPPVSYAGYTGVTQMLGAVFVAAQAPILFSRDLRHGSIVLYLSRPLHASSYALARWAALATAMIIFLLAPVLLLYVGALLAGADFSEQSKDAALAAVAVCILATVLASIAGLISAWSTRRGFAVVATIAVLLFLDGVVSAIQGIALGERHPLVGEFAGLVSPYRLYRGLVEARLDVEASAITPPTSAGMEVAYAAVLLLMAMGGAALLVLRYRRVAAR
jgi:ABC-2 type transport system permease protein